MPLHVPYSEIRTCRPCCQRFGSLKQTAPHFGKGKIQVTPCAYAQVRVAARKCSHPHQRTGLVNVFALIQSPRRGTGGLTSFVPQAAMAGRREWCLSNAGKKRRFVTEEKIRLFDRSILAEFTRITRPTSECPFHRKQRKTLPLSRPPCSWECT